MQEASEVVHHDQPINRRSHQATLPAAPLLWAAGRPGFLLSTGELLCQSLTQSGLELQTNA